MQVIRYSEDKKKFQCYCSVKVKQAVIKIWVVAGQCNVLSRHVLDWFGSDTAPDICRQFAMSINFEVDLATQDCMHYTKIIRLHCNKLPCCVDVQCLIKEN
jgi:hypothetical protein